MRLISKLCFSTGVFTVPKRYKKGSMKKLIMSAILVATVSLALAQVRGQSATNGSTNAAPAYTLPLRLPIGSELEVRSYIVGTNNLGLNLGMNTWVGFGYLDTNGDYQNLRCGINRQGYASYEAFLDDTTNAAALILDDFLHGTDAWDYIPGSDIYANIAVSYFNDSGGVSPVGTGEAMYIYQNIGPIQNATIGSIRNAFSISTSNIVISESIYIPSPTMTNFETVIDLPGKGSNCFSWSLASGVRASSGWPTTPYNGTTRGWIDIDKFASVGTNAARFTIGLADGQSAVYTHKGDRIAPPGVNVASDAKSIDLKVPRGADVAVYSSSNFVNWTVISSFNSSNSANYSLPIVKCPNNMFFRASCKAYGQQ